MRRRRELAGHQASAWARLSGVKGSARGRMPSASVIAAAMAAMVGAMLASPAPRKGWSGRAMMSTATFGTSEKRRMG